MAANTLMSISWLPFTGRLVGAVLGAGVVLFVSYIACLATGLLQFRTVQIPTFERYESIRWSIHFFGSIVDDSEPLFRFLCVLLLFPSLAVGALLWHHFGLRWKRRHES